MPNNTITFRRFHPGGGVHGRCSYGIAGVAGIVVFDCGLFPDPANPPKSIDLNCALAEPKVSKKDAVTSAVVASANVAQADAAGTPIADPKQVAEVASKKSAEVVAAVASKTDASAKPRVVKAHTV